MGRRSGASPPAAPLACPSAPPEWEDAQLLGVVEGTVNDPEIRFVPLRPVTPELLALAEPVLPTEVFRFTARCREGACSQFRDGRCGVAAATVEYVAADATRALPACAIRTTCRWWSESGAEACRRCRHIVTDDASRTGAYAEALAGKI